MSSSQSTCEILSHAPKQNKMGAEPDDDFERVSAASVSDDESDDGFVETEIDTPQSTPPNLTPTGTTQLIPSRTKRWKCTWDGCTKAFVRQSRLEEHMRTHTGERPFTCPYDNCSKAYFRESHLKVHVDSSHKTDKDHKCTWKGCDKGFATNQRLRNHLKTHEVREKYKCTGYEGCSETFRKKETLRRHIMTEHEKSKPFPCPDIDSMNGELCAKAFDTAQRLREHQKTHHDPFRFSCAECLRDNASSLAVEPADQQQPLKEAYFATMVELQLHNAEVHPPTCSHCSETFGSSRQLSAHLELIHDIKQFNEGDPKADFACPYDNCDKSYSKRGNLNMHVRKIHEKSQTFICGQTEVTISGEDVPEDVVITGCGKSCASKQVLEDHIRSIHLGLQSFQTRRKRKAAGKDGSKQKRNRIDDPAVNFGDNSTTEAAQEIPGFIWPATGWEDFGEDQEVGDLSESMSLLGSHIYHHGQAYHFPSGEYPASTNISPDNYQPQFMPHGGGIDDDFFGPLDSLNSFHA